MPHRSGLNRDPRCARYDVEVWLPCGQWHTAVPIECLELAIGVEP